MDQNRPYRELTPASLIGGVLVGALLNMGIVFAGLQIGFTIVGSTVGAILGFGLLRGILGKGSILEVNIFQTIASSVNTVNAGIIFTVPVLFLLGYREQGLSWSLGSSQWIALLIAGISGSLLGVVMIIPLRRQIIDFERLRFPSAVAVATILKSPGAGMEKAVLLVIGMLIAGTITFCAMDWSDLAWVQAVVEWIKPGAKTLLPDHFNLGEIIGAPAGLRLFFAVSLLSLGAGFLAGRSGLAILYGTILNYWVLIPLCLALGWVPEAFAGFDFWGKDYETGAGLSGAFRNFTANKVGIGMILGGAIAGLLLAAPALKAAIASLAASKGQGGRQEEVGLGVIGVSTVVGFLGLLVAAHMAGGDFVTWPTALLVGAAGLIWLWLAGLVVAQTTGRTDWSPLSGLSLIAIAILMALLGVKNSESILPAVTIGAAICVATSMCADMMADLKTGYLVGGRPYKQQVAQLATCWIGPGIALLTVWLLWHVFAFGPDQAKILYERAVHSGSDAVAALTAAGGGPETLAKGVPKLEAPQASALEAAINIVQSGDIPLGKYLTGFALGLLVSLLVSPGLGVMVGLSLYMPFMYMIVFGIGGLLSVICMRLFGAKAVESKGVPLAAGLIVGEALVSIVNAIIKVVSSL
ncbi:MAG: OPT/YSL family transporter [Planctomycetota bacterium]